MPELLKSGLVGHGGDEEKVIKNWENSGLLEGLSDGVIKTKIALTLEDAAQILLNVQKYANTPYDVILFPVIRRTITMISDGRLTSYDERIEIAEFITAEFILKELNRIYEPCFQAFSKIFENSKMDIEAETAAFVSEKIAILFIKEFKNKNILKKFDFNGDRIVAPKPLIENGE